MGRKGEEVSAGFLLPWVNVLPVGHELSQTSALQMIWQVGKHCQVTHMHFKLKSMQKWVLQWWLNPNKQPKTRIGKLVVNALEQIIPKYKSLKQQTFTLSQFLVQESRCGLARNLWLKLSHEVALLSGWAAVPSKDLTGGGSTFKSTQVAVGRLQFLASSWTQSSATCWTEASLSSLPPGSLHRAAYNMAAGFLKSERVSKSRCPGWEPQIFYNLISEVAPLVLGHNLFTRSKSHDLAHTKRT